MLKGLGNLANLGQMMQQAQQVGARMKELQERMKAERVTGTAGGGMVEVTMSGSQEVLAVRLDPGLVERGEREMLEDLLPAAINDAAQKARQRHAEALQEITGGIDLPGLGDMMEKFTGGTGA
ncbi:YbaB/EbfC family nucleoid-associated protein [Botrimarina hoheduenensis]|uniref:Nucleoid-associated protein Pla111_12330 n=1 Tax=Botrimarina hoheduenensis TaxID=2528000 RepID=A0A5C5W9R7_9BACT|nr:YbaB/EbfC family nucleoid-associated protein [Botrimarina hoheduenensis]TWT47618.1 Nucleoid-associated protein YbaB [Botrimarina hoheduenensis]